MVPGGPGRRAYSGTWGDRSLAADKLNATRAWRVEAWRGDARRTAACRAAPSAGVSGQAARVGACLSSAKIAAGLPADAVPTPGMTT
jgi:hypothetical protein